MAKRKARPPVDDNYDEEEDEPQAVVSSSLTPQENEAWSFFQNPECPLIIELFDERRFASAMVTRVVELLEVIQPYIVRAPLFPLLSSTKPLSRPGGLLCTACPRSRLRGKLRPSSIYSLQSLLPPFRDSQPSNAVPDDPQLHPKGYLC
jgi:hypothetical protein